MPIENPIPPFAEWFSPAMAAWFYVVLHVAVGGLVLGYLIVAVRYGPIRGLEKTFGVLMDGLRDLVFISPRRVTALAWLGIKEAIRRRVVTVFAVFIVILLFAGWFLDTSSDEPAKLYLSFVLTSTSYLVLAMALFLSAFSLPIDLRNRTLHTIVTKPVRSSEIVLGRIVGFALVGTVLLVVMSAISYVFVVRGLDHTHDIVIEELKSAGQPSASSKSQAKIGLTRPTQGHRHKVYIDEDGKARLETEHSHWHDVESRPSGSKTPYLVGNPVGNLLARVPVYGSLRFRDRNGVDTDKGVCVGDEWMYRSYIQGQTPAAAIWTFRNIRREAFPTELPIEMNIGVFRTHKGNIEKGVLGSLALRNPVTGLTVEVTVFESREFKSFKVSIPRKIVKFVGTDLISRKIETSQGIEYRPPKDSLDKSLANKREFDLFDDLVADGEIEVWLRCIEPAQYFGAGMPDMYLRAEDASFRANFFKGYLGIWFQMVLTITFGVTFSTFLSGPVAMIATIGAMIGGFFSDFMVRLANGQVYGGGPFESIIRLVTQENVVSELEPGLKTDFAKGADLVAERCLKIIAAILPPFDQFSYADRVAYGFDITWDPLISVPMVRTIAFFVPVFVAGYFFLKTREVAR